MRASRQTGSGFSLIEVLVAVAIISASGVTLVSAHSAFARASTAASRQAVAEARAEMLRLITTPEPDAARAPTETGKASGFELHIDWQSHEISLDGGQTLTLMLPVRATGDIRDDVP